MNAGDALVLETAFAGGGHLNASGEAFSVESFTGVGFEDISGLVFVSKKGNDLDRSARWKVEKTGWRAPQKKSEKTSESP